MYHEEIERLLEKYPQNICCLHAKSPNDINTRNEILDFIKYHGNRNLEGDYHTHKQRTFFNKMGVNFAEFGINVGRQILPKSVRHQLWIKFAKFFYN
jgi:hypothetical protein